jgi:hypothetical protein
MPEKNARRRAATKKRQGKTSSSQAGEYVREEMRKARKGRRKSAKQAIAIGLSQARREGVPVKPPKKKATRKKAQADTRRGAAKKSTARKKSTSKKSTSRKAAKRS